MYVRLACILLLVAVLQPLVTSSLTTSSVSLLTITLCSLNGPVGAIFNFFRRRGRESTTSMPDMDFSDGPRGPINLGFMGRTGGLFNPLQFGQGFLPHMGQSPFSAFDYMRPQVARRGFQALPGIAPGELNFNQMEQNFQQETGFSDSAPPSMSHDEAESFFTLLSETDEGMCISRLVCEMGANPMGAGEFGQTITEVIGGLQNFPAGSKASYYSEVMQTGMAGGLSVCASRFSSCDEESLNFVKNAQLSENQS